MLSVLLSIVGLDQVIGLDIVIGLDQVVGLELLNCTGIISTLHEMYQLLVLVAYLAFTTGLSVHEYSEHQLVEPGEPVKLYCRSVYVQFMYGSRQLFL